MLILNSTLRKHLCSLFNLNLPLDCLFKRFDTQIPTTCSTKGKVERDKSISQYASGIIETIEKDLDEMNEILTVDSLATGTKGNFNNVILTS